MKITLFLAALVILGNPSAHGQQYAGLTDAEIRQLRADAYLDTNEQILTVDTHTLGRNQVFFVTKLNNRIDWCLNAYVYADDKGRFKRLWAVGEAFSENGCHPESKTCGEPSAGATREGELQLTFPTLEGKGCTLHRVIYRWNGHTFILNERQIVPAPTK